MRVLGKEHKSSNPLSWKTYRLTPNSDAGAPTPYTIRMTQYTRGDRIFQKFNPFFNFKTGYSFFRDGNNRIILLI